MAVVNESSIYMKYVDFIDYMQNRLLRETFSAS
jgi:hypothetical protein